MINARRFANALSGSVGGQGLYGAASAERSAKRLLPLKAVPSDREVDAALAAAEARLRAHPEKYSGDPEGIFTYEDFVLAAALYYLRKATTSNQKLYGSAGPQGDKLKEGWYRPEWIKTGLKALFSRMSHTREQLAAMTPDEPLNHSSAKMRIAVCGDAGYLGVAQDKVIRMILDRHKEDPFDYAIHLGDVYFAGDIDEMALNFLNPFARLTKKGMKLFTLVGNHDLYYGGTSFIFAMNMLQQPGRYFRIDSPHWRIACLDTSLGAINIAGDDARLDPKQLEWFDSMLAEKDDRPLVMMSHHFAISGWSKPAISLTSQLSDRVNDKVFAWYWGHEHNCALYPKSGSNTYWGACVGNGSFIEKYAEPTRPTTPAWFPKKPCTCYPQKKSYWPHGFVELEFSKGKIEETAYLENKETFKRTLV
jgi:hypothetical protein